MTTSTSRLAYQDCFELMDKALSNKKGIKFPATDVGAAKHFRLRLHAARTVDRKDNWKEFEEGHPMHGRSAYDTLVVRIETIKGKVWIKIEKYTTDHLEIQPLGEEEDVIDQAVNSNRGEVEGEGLAERGEGQVPEIEPQGFEDETQVVSSSKARRI